MQVNATVVEGLRREFQVVVPASELDGRLATRLNALQGEVRIKGFRPGKVPVAHLKRMFGKSEMAQIVQAVINEVARDTLADRGERAAQQPDFQLSEDEGAAEKVLNGEADLAYTMSYEVLPKVELADFGAIVIERPVADVSDAEIETEIEKLAESARSFSPKAGKAETGDRLTIAYAGKVDGEAFPGGTDDNATVRLGTSQFIPGFAEQLEGMAAGAGGDDDDGTVLLEGRNDRALEVLAQQLAAGKREIGIYYGAAHMPDMEAKLIRDFGFHKVSERTLVAWDITKRKDGEKRR